MTKRTEEIVKWWYPEDADQEFAGILHYSPDEEPRLESESDSFRPHQKRRDLIHGRTTIGTHFSLGRCIEIAIFNRKTIYGRYLFREMLVPSLEDTKFKEVSLTFPALGQWGAEDDVLKLERLSSKSMDLKIRHKKAKSIHVGNGITAKIGAHVDSNISRTKLVFDTVLAVAFKTAKARNFDYFMRLIERIEHFFSLLALRPVFSDRIHLKGTFYEKRIKGKRVAAFGELLQKQRSLSDTDVMRHDFLLTFSDIRNRLPQILENWFAIEDQYSATVSLYLASHNKQIYREQSFLMLCQAIEAYYRIRHSAKNLYVDKKSFKGTIRPRLLEALDEVDIPQPLGKLGEEDVRSILKDKVNYLNEITFRSKLTIVVDEHREALESLEINSTDLAGSIVKMRNDLVHLKAGDALVTLDRLNLEQHRVHLQMLMEFCLLSDLGFSTEQIRNLVDEKAVIFKNRLYK